MTYIQGPTPPMGPDPIQPLVNGAGPVQKSEAGEPQDQVNISEVARWKAKLAETPAIRQELVDAVRAEIEAGSYDTIDKIQVAAEKLLDELKEDGFI